MSADPIAPIADERMSAEAADPSVEEPAAPETELARRLREATPEELSRLLAEHLERFGPDEAVAALRNPFLESDGARMISERPGLVSAYSVRRALALCPRAPEVVALDLVGGLYWADLLAVSVEVRVRPTVRRAAETALLVRLPRLAIGEKIAIARRCGAGVIAVLRGDPTPRVIAALLENPRLTEGLLGPALASERALPALLQAVAANPRWGARHDLRLLICRNPKTPVAIALPLLPGLRKDELRGIAADGRLATPLRRRAELLSGGVG